MPSSSSQKKLSLLELNGFDLHPSYLDCDQQKRILEDIRTAIVDAPLYHPVMPYNGQPMSVKTASCGQWGWYSDRKDGYRYIAHHPQTGKSWPPIPPLLLEIWKKLVIHAGLDSRLPDSCLINFYGPKAKMGLHQDRDEEDFSCPILSISLGDTALFRVGGLRRKDPTRSIRLYSGDVCLLHGPLRLAYHGIDWIEPDSSPLLKQGGRLNLTLRRAKK